MAEQPTPLRDERAAAIARRAACLPPLTPLQVANFAALARQLDVEAAALVGRLQARAG